MNYLPKNFTKTFISIIPTTYFVFTNSTNFGFAMLLGNIFQRCFDYKETDTLQNRILVSGLSDILSNDSTSIDPNIANLFNKEYSELNDKETSKRLVTYTPFLLFGLSSILFSTPFSVPLLGYFLGFIISRISEQICDNIYPQSNVLGFMKN